MTDPVEPAEPDAPEATTGFERDISIDKPGIVGARWWHKSLIQQDSAIRRRAILKGVAVAGGVIGVITLAGVGIAKVAKSFDSDVQTRDAIAMQRLYGWDFGAPGEPLVFDGIDRKPFVKDDLKKLAAIMKPARFGAFYVTTLLESLEARPESAVAKHRADVDAVDTNVPAWRPLIEVIEPRCTPAMSNAYLAGEALARLCLGTSPAAAVLVDLAGPEAVAFAAGACAVFEPVLLLDNWPHPRGVVASHLALSALAYYQPRFEKQSTARASKDVMPLFVLDRGRTLSYSEASDRFDNRYLARMPSGDAIAKLGVKHLFYVVGTPQNVPEPDDLNLTLSSMSPAIEARALARSEFDGPPPKPPSTDATGLGVVGTDADAFHYGGSADSDASLWLNYPWVPAPSPPPFRIAPSTLKDYRFIRRASATTTVPSNFGKVAVAISGGLVVGAILRRGSMNRASGGWGG